MRLFNFCIHAFSLFKQVFVCLLEDDRVGNMWLWEHLAWWMQMGQQAQADDIQSLEKSFCTGRACGAERTEMPSVHRAVHKEQSSELYFHGVVLMTQPQSVKFGMWAIHLHLMPVPFHSPHAPFILVLYYLIGKQINFYYVPLQLWILVSWARLCIPIVKNDGAWLFAWTFIQIDVQLTLAFVCIKQQDAVVNCLLTELCGGEFPSK